VFGGRVDPGHQRGRGGRERGGGGALAQAGGPQPAGTVRDHVQRGRDGEGGEPAEQDRAGTDAVGEGAEERFQQDLGAVVQGEQATEDEQGRDRALGVAAEAGGDAVRPEGGGEPGSVERPHLPGLRRLLGHDCSSSCCSSGAPSSPR
jgi:hypothetical protein